jgi:hypothetical protein
MMRKARVVRGGVNDHIDTFHCIHERDRVFKISDAELYP